MASGLRPRELCRVGSKRMEGAGGSSAIIGDGYMRGMRLKWER